MTLKESEMLSLLRERGENPALPFLFFSNEGELLYANPRALKILNISIPISSTEMQKKWLFFNEEMAGPAVFERTLKGISKEARILAQLSLQTFRIWSYRNEKPKGVLVILELVRKGDLIEDRESRQHLFRVLAHEIRTSAQILGSYVEMTKSHDQHLASRMEEGVKRLERAVALLQELKSELELK